jgi:hypothetical protein
MVELDPNRSITLEAGIWRREDIYLPAITCWRNPANEHNYIAIKIPLTP